MIFVTIGGSKFTKRQQLRRSSPVRATSPPQVPSFHITISDQQKDSGRRNKNRNDHILNREHGPFELGCNPHGHTAGKNGRKTTNRAKSQTANTNAVRHPT
jgi:hypothetical protein